MTSGPGPSVPAASHNNEFLVLAWWPAEGTALEAAFRAVQASVAISAGPRARKEPS